MNDTAVKKNPTHSELLDSSKGIAAEVSKAMSGRNFYVDNVVRKTWVTQTGEVVEYPTISRYSQSYATGEFKGDVFQIGTVNPRSFTTHTPPRYPREFPADHRELSAHNLAEVSLFVWSREYQQAYRSMATNVSTDDCCIAEALGHVYEQLRQANPAGAIPTFDVVGDISTLENLRPKLDSTKWKPRSVDFPQRFDIVDGVVVERHPYKEKGASGLEVDPLYASASHTATNVFSPEAMVHLVPGPVEEWAGLFTWKEMADGRGFYHMHYLWGPQVLRPDLAFSILSPRPTHKI